MLDQLPKSMRESVKAAMNEAYGTRDPDRAKRLLQNLARRLASGHPRAAASLEEGLEETLTVKRLGLEENLERIFSTTNLIENLNGQVRELTRRVKRWRGGAMILRWTAAGLLQAERHFRRVKGSDHMPELLAALKRHEEKFTSTAADQQAAA